MIGFRQPDHHSISGRYDFVPDPFWRRISYVGIFLQRAWKPTFIITFVIFPRLPIRLLTIFWKSIFKPDSKTPEGDNEHDPYDRDNPMYDPMEWNRASGLFFINLIKSIFK
jgi:hypothetical protein